MNGIDKITARLDQQARGLANREISEAKLKATTMTEQATAQAEKLAAELAAKGDKIAAEREERLVSVASMESRKIMLAAKQELMDKVYAGALEKMCSAPDDQKKDHLVKLLVKAAPDGTGEIVFNEKDRASVGAAAVEAANAQLGGSLVLSEKTAPVKGGFMLVKGSVELNCTYETLVRLQKGEAAAEVAKLLFEEN